MKKPIRVLIVDDSALVRRALGDVLEDGTGEFEIMARATDPFDAVRRLRKEVPDVMVLDIEMPKMDGVTFLRKLMRQHPIPTVICSSLAKDAAPVTLAALEAGAVDVITKPDLSTQAFFQDSQQKIQSAVRIAAGAQVRPPTTTLPPPAVAKPLTRLTHTTSRLIAIGASTGGTEAILEVLRGLDAHTAGILIAQHMPPGFTAAFAKRLDEQTPLHVREAKDGDQILMGQALIAPGDFHLAVRRSGARYIARVHQADKVNRHRPAVDVLFRSVAHHAGKSAMGVILTGMGDDGAAGLLAMREAGAQTIAQDQKSCVVFGMPGEAIRAGAVSQVLPLHQISSAVSRWSELPPPSSKVS